MRSNSSAAAGWQRSALKLAGEESPSSAATSERFRVANFEPSVRAIKAAVPSIPLCGTDESLGRPGLPTSQYVSAFLGVKHSDSEKAIGYDEIGLREEKSCVTHLSKQFFVG